MSYTQRSNRGLDLLERGEPRAAREELETALAAARSAVGEDHPDVATIRSNLAAAGGVLPPGRPGSAGILARRESGAAAWPAGVR